MLALRDSYVSVPSALGTTVLREFPNRRPDILRLKLFHRKKHLRDLKASEYPFPMETLASSLGLGPGLPGFRVEASQNGPYVLLKGRPQNPHVVLGVTWSLRDLRN